MNFMTFIDLNFMNFNFKSKFITVHMILFAAALNVITNSSS